MKRILLILGVLSLCLAAFTPPSSADAAAQVFRFRGGGQIASATFSHTEGTLVTTTDIFTIEGFNQAPPSEPTRSPTLMTAVVIFQYDTTCPPEEGCPFIMDAFGFTETPVFQFDRNLASAEVQATVTMTDLVSGRTFPLAIDLNWIGIGETRHVGGSHRLGEPGVCIFITTGQNYFRLAGVSGSVIDLDTGFNFTSQGDPMSMKDKSSLTSTMALLILILTACNPETSISTPTTGVAISRDEAVQLATEQCRMHKFALIGKPSTTKAILMSRGEAEKWTFPSQAATEDIQKISEPVWLVEIQREFQLEGGPLPESVTRPTGEPPRRGVCWVIVDAKTGEILGMQGQTN